MVDSLRGLTWDHPRGYCVLDELARLDSIGVNPFGSVHSPAVWDRQPLVNFEATPLRELADIYDLLVIDHPNLGQAVDDGALLALDELFDESELMAWRVRAVGSTFDCYNLRGRQWALPIDAAAQVGVKSESLAAEAPKTWGDACVLAKEVPTVLCLGGPHAFLMLQAMCVALGQPEDGEHEYAIEPSVGGEALEVMAELLDNADRELSMLDPIGVLEAMSAGGPAYCPLVFGYATYSKRNQGALTFFDAPEGGTGRIGSVLGGAGIAISSHVRDTSAAAEHLRRLLDVRVQQDLYEVFGGQSMDTEVWSDTAGLNSLASQFYLGTRKTLEQAWVRPRCAGYTAFQALASYFVRSGLYERASGESILSALNASYRSLKGM